MSLEILKGMGYVGEGLILFVIAKWINDLLTPYKVDKELTEKDNLALAFSISGYILGIIIILICAILGPSQGFWADIKMIALYGLLGILLLNISRWINDKLILYKFNNQKEIIDDRNVGTGAVQCGSYIASGLFIGGAIAGEGGGIHTLLVFFLLGQVILILLSLFYQFITPYDIHKEIEDDNIAVGIGFGGSLIAIGIILMKAIFGNFISWSESLKSLGIYAGLGFCLVLILRIFLDKIILPRTNLHKEIIKDKNVGAGLLEFVVLISFATMVAVSI